jgi:hypothetical protein
MVNCPTLNGITLQYHDKITLRFLLDNRYPIFNTRLVRSRTFSARAASFDKDWP